MFLRKLVQLVTVPVYAPLPIFRTPFMSQQEWDQRVRDWFYSNLYDPKDFVEFFRSVHKEIRRVADTGVPSVRKPLKVHPSLPPEPMFETCFREALDGALDEYVRNLRTEDQIIAQLAKDYSVPVIRLFQFTVASRPFPDWPQKLRSSKPRNFPQLAIVPAAHKDDITPPLVPVLATLPDLRDPLTLMIPPIRPSKFDADYISARQPTNIQEAVISPPSEGTKDFFDPSTPYHISPAFMLKRDDCYPP